MVGEFCPCGSEKIQDDCCLPFIKGQTQCPTAEALMRSRYTAYTLCEIDYILNTHDPSGRSEFDIDGARKWAKDAQWRKLEIIEVIGGGEHEKKGSVEFKAHYSMNGDDHELHEQSQFVRKQEQWFYTHGRSPSIQQFTREAPKVGRNDPCPCGSQKKYKKCCARA